MKKLLLKLVRSSFVVIVNLSVMQLLGTSETSVAQKCTLSAPSQITVNSISSCSVTYSWTQVSGANKYKVKYKKSGTSSWQSNLKISDTTYTFSGLSSATSYVLSVQSVCSSGKVSTSSKTTTITTNACSLPASYSAITTGTNSEKISVTAACSFDSLRCRYGNNKATLGSYAASRTDELTLSGLSQGLTYYYQISTCPLSDNNFTAIDSFVLTEPVPNIVIIIVDDARFDAYSCEGAPAFMQTPNIDRIANEGIRFENSFVVHSLCAPSRATIATGMYTNRHMVIDNVKQQQRNKSIPVLPQILHDHGYTTALVGKNHAVFDYNNGQYFDYWLEFTSREDGYNLSYKYGSKSKTLAGYSTDVLTDSAVAVIYRAQQPYLLWLAYHAPHEPFVPADEYVHTFDDETIGFGPDTAKYAVNYPSPIYNINSSLVDHVAADSIQRKVLEMMLSVDDGVGAVLSALESRGELENTMIIFTSDNGHMLGEHNLDMKRVAYEPSLRVPLFIRYPSWFPAGTVDSSNFALNIDLAPTVLEAAGIPNTYNMDGQSIRNFYTHSSSRDIFYYHYWYSTEGSWYKLPFIHAVRDKNYILIDYGCQTGPVQEFFDLRNDPLQMTNLINTSAYATQIGQYRFLLDSFKTAYSDTLTETTIDCSLSNPSYTREQHPIFANSFVCFPNPSAGSIVVQNTGNGDLEFDLLNELGQRLDHFAVRAGDEIRLDNLTPGIRYLQSTGIDGRDLIKLVVQ
ncbi:MAG: sulfatase-like hydrolase/transferase [Bacteroidetes bacterium]|nr:sulfatase-like hydrolase/transferase [Bacteroidota bacterium]